MYKGKEREEPLVPIHVKPLSGKNITIRVGLDYPVEIVKEVLRTKGVAPGNDDREYDWFLKFENMRLGNSKTLQSYGIYHGATLIIQQPNFLITEQEWEILSADVYEKKFCYLTECCTKDPPPPMCQNFLRGNCRWGYLCQKSHMTGGKPLRSDFDYQNSSTSNNSECSFGPCKAFQTGSCKYGDKCKYQHIPEARPNCRDFANGRCERGKQCNYSHRSENNQKIRRETYESALEKWQNSLSCVDITYLKDCEDKEERGDKWYRENC